MPHLLRYLSVSFSIPTIYRNELPAFRGAIAQKVGFEHDFFHNHQEKSGFIYRYPLIQYKLFKQHQPGILCLQEGVDNIYHLFEKKSWDISLHNEPINLKIAHLKMEQYQLQVHNRMFPFRINGWQALNQKNYQTYRGIESMTERIEMLEKLLIAHLLWFAKGVGWMIEERIDLSITNISEMKPLDFKKTPVLAFNVEFKTNMFIPPQIGIGKGASRGLGTVYPNHTRFVEQTETPITPL